MTDSPLTVRLAAGPWRLWRDIGLRGAGFPAGEAGALWDDDLAADADSGRLTEDGWHAAIARLSDRLLAAAASPRLREAVAWQNPQAVLTCLDKVARREPRNKRRRAHEATVASYLQRYCLKNDSIGFFGPVGWAWADPCTPALSVVPGPALLARRTTYFETWAINEVARTIAAREEVLPWLAPRAVPSNVLAGRVLHRSRGRPVTLTESEAALLAGCDGTRTVKDLGGDVALRRLRDLGAVRVDLDVPVQARPERALRAVLARIGDPVVRARALGEVNELTAARDRLAAAAGDADEVMTAWADLNERFHRITGVPATRNAGRAYAGRTLCYEDTVRDARVRVGASVLDALASPLTLVLDSARWLVAEVGERYRRLFAELFQRECERTGGSTIPAGRLLVMATPMLPMGSARVLSEPVAGAVAEFQRRWRQILDLPPRTRRHSVRSPAIAERAGRLFPARKVLWSAGGHHSPDVMVAESRDDPLLVLGELHLAVNTLEARVMVEQHEDRDRLLAAVDIAHGDRRVHLLPRSDAPFVTSRSIPPSALLSGRHTYVAVDQGVVDVPGRVLPIAGLLVERRGDTLIARSRTGGGELTFMELIGEVLTGAVVNAFRPLGEAEHQPRVTIDRMVVHRETWRFPAADAPWAFAKNERERFEQARRWRARHEMPELVFLRVPNQDKPVAVHFGSPALVNVAAKAIRQGESLQVTEMLPALDQLWLVDGEGRRYTSEFRFVAVDGRQRAESS